VRSHAASLISDDKAISELVDILQGQNNNNILQPARKKSGAPPQLHQQLVNGYTTIWVSKQHFDMFSISKPESILTLPLLTDQLNISIASSSNPRLY